MSEDRGEKTEQATPKKMEEALKQGQIARSPEVQTVFVLMGGLAALYFSGYEMWQHMVGFTVLMLSHLHNTPIEVGSLQAQGVVGTFLLLKCVGPVALGTMLAGLLAGAVQNRFNTASEALNPKFERLNPVEGFQRLFSARAAIPTLLAVVKIMLIIALTWSEISSIVEDPIFTTSVSTARMATFLADVCVRLFLRVGLVLMVLAAADYGYQWWQTNKDLMMSHDELKDEMKNTEGNPAIKAARRRRRSVSKAKMLADVPQADIVVTNPTHIAVALKYDKKSMKAPMIVAKGIRLNAKSIREVAQQHQIPIIENKPLARMLFKHGRVGGEIPAQLYIAVAELLAWAYRVNRYRYYTDQQNQK
jgi:flagellar biosynthesis protein FlhB